MAQAVEKKQQNKESLPAPLRVALVGVGNELNGDDAAGNQVASRLMAIKDLPASFLSFDAGSLPENASGPLRRFAPDLVVLVDAADFGGHPGEIRWLEAKQIGGLSASSHTLPLSVLGKFLEAELHCRVAYLGIQPEQLTFTADLSPTVAQAVDEVVQEIRTLMRPD